MAPEKDYEVTLAYTITVHAVTNPFHAAQMATEQLADADPADVVSGLVMTQVRELPAPPQPAKERPS